MGLFQQMFGKIPDQSPTGIASADAGAMKIVREYGAVPEGKQTRFGNISSLPYTKDTIKSALIHLLRRISKDVTAQTYLLLAYLLLADWQEAGAAVNYACLQLRDNPTAKQIKQSAQGFLSSGVYEMTTKVVSDMQHLVTELEAQGLWHTRRRRYELNTGD